MKIFSSQKMVTVKLVEKKVIGQMNAPKHALITTIKTITPATTNRYQHGIKNGLQNPMENMTNLNGNYLALEIPNSRINIIHIKIRNHHTS